MEDQNNPSGQTNTTPVAPVSPEPQAQQKPDEQNKKFMGLLAYLGPLVIIPFVIAREDSFVKFHIKQGLVLLIVNLLVGCASVVIWPLAPLWYITSIVLFVLSGIGIMNVFAGKEKDVPLVGHYAAKINI